MSTHNLFPCRIKGGWQKFYVILESHELSFYTDHKVRDSPGAKPLSIYCVLQSTISPYTKDKKKSIFQVSVYLVMYIMVGERSKVYVHVTRSSVILVSLIE